jgi:predicted Rossmann-fold nucleotide-binding protein
MSRNKGYYEVETQEELYSILKRGGNIIRHCFQNIDFTGLDLCDCVFRDCMFMGCRFKDGMKELIDKSCLVFSRLDTPYNAFRNKLYTSETLYAGYCKGMSNSYAQCYDGVVYQHYLAKGKVCSDIKETLARTLHDYAISDALHEFLADYDERKIVGIMGGHGLLRTDAAYRKVANISKKLAEMGFLMVSGGGPGAMEATHLGAWMAGRGADELDNALYILSASPSFSDDGWLDTAFEVKELYPQNEYKSLGVPTWLYGHEPATPFATHIAKYFDNAIREDGILTIAMGGIVYSPGSAGTMQEIFQDAVQNHYLSFGYASPMVFLDKKYWREEMPVYPMLQQLQEKGKYRNLILSVYDDEMSVVDELMKFQNIR